VRPARWASIWETLHRWALRQAARVIVLGDDARERIIAKGVAPERVVVVPRTCRQDEPARVRNRAIVRDG